MKKTSTIFLTLVSGLSLNMAKAQEPYPEDKTVPDTLREDYVVRYYYYDPYYMPYRHVWFNFWFHGYWGHCFHPHCGNYGYWNYSRGGPIARSEPGVYYGPRNMRSMNARNGGPSTHTAGRPASAGSAGNASTRGGLGHSGSHSGARAASS